MSDINELSDDYEKTKAEFKSLEEWVQGDVGPNVRKHGKKIFVFADRLELLEARLALTEARLSRLEVQVEN